METFKRRKLTSEQREAYSFVAPHTPPVDVGVPVPPAAFPQRIADETEAIPHPKHTDAFVISLHAFDAQEAEPQQVEVLDAIQGIYWKIGYHFGRPYTVSYNGRF